MLGISIGHPHPLMFSVACVLFRRRFFNVVIITGNILHYVTERDERTI